MVARDAVNVSHGGPINGPGSRRVPLPAVILSGGQSSRMGRPKALLPWPSSRETFLARLVNAAREGGAGPVAVVTGAHHAEIAPAAEALGVTVLFNPAHAVGQLTSLQCGLAWAFAHTTGAWAMMTLVDVPGVQPETIRRLDDATREGDAWIVRPSVGDRHGHPVFWHRTLLPRLLAADPALGARALVHALVAEGRVRDVHVDDPGVLVDVDTPADLDALTTRVTASPRSRG